MSNRAPLLSALFLLNLALPLSAANRWPLPLFSSDPAAVIKAAAERPSQKSAAIILLDYHVTLRFLPNGQIRRVHRMVYSVLNESGVNQLTKISASWLAWRTEKPAIRVRVVTRDGIAHVLDPQTITEAGVPSRVEGLYSDLKVLSAPLPSLGPGSVVEAEIVTDDRETVNPGGALEELLFTPGFPIEYLNVTLEAPVGVPLHVEEKSLPQLARKETAADGVQRLELSASDLNPDKPIPMAPPEAAGDPQLVISDVADWQQVAKWYSGVVERQVGVSSPVVDANTDPASRLTEIDSILAGIQKEVRYTGVELGFAAIEPRKPSETLSRGYGDCKDKAALLVSRLRKAGIASTLALLTPYPAPDVLPSVPGIEAFTHAIVYLPGKNPLWIDPTAEFASAHRLPWADHGRLALVVDPLTTTLTRIPEDQAAGELTVNTLTMNLSEDGKAVAELVREDSGGIEDYMRPTYLAGLQASDSRREALVSQIQEQMAVGKVKSIDWGTPNPA